MSLRYSTFVEALLTDLAKNDVAAMRRRTIHGRLFQPHWSTATATDTVVVETGSLSSPTGSIHAAHLNVPDTVISTGGGTIIDTIIDTASGTASDTIIGTVRNNGIVRNSGTVVGTVVDTTESDVEQMLLSLCDALWFKDAIPIYPSRGQLASIDVPCPSEELCLGLGLDLGEAEFDLEGLGQPMGKLMGNLQGNPKDHPQNPQENPKKQKKLWANCLYKSRVTNHLAETRTCYKEIPFDTLVERCGIVRDEPDLFRKMLFARLREFIDADGLVHFEQNLGVNVNKSLSNSTNERFERLERLVSISLIEIPL